VFNAVFMANVVDAADVADVAVVLSHGDNAA